MLGSNLSVDTKENSLFFILSYVIQVEWMNVFILPVDKNFSNSFYLMVEIGVN